MKNMFKSISKKFGSKSPEQNNPNNNTKPANNTNSPPNNTQPNTSNAQINNVTNNITNNNSTTNPISNDKTESKTNSNTNSNNKTSDANNTKHAPKKSLSIPTASFNASNSNSTPNNNMDITSLSDLADDKPDVNGLTRADLLKPIAILADAPASQKQQIFIQKLKLCSVMFDWFDDANNSSPSAVRDSKAKEIKRQQLLELVEYIGKNKNIYSEVVLGEIISMVSLNLFRALPPLSSESNSNNGGSSGSGSGGGEDSEEPVFEASWPHLQIVYEFFLRFIVSSDVDIKTLKKYINGTFVLRLLELFDSEDHRERDYLKTILHRIYAKFMSLRAFIRKAINNVFYIFIYDTERHNGIAELLEILGSIINGFALPLKAEHKTFLKRVLTPMHRVRSINQFHQQLSYCVTQFVDKDPTLAIPVLQGLIKYWPITNSSKQVLFLNELEELLELTQAAEFKILLPQLFHQISLCIGSPHFQVSERALFLWHNEYISNLIADYRFDILPILYPVLYNNSQNHWNPTVNNLTQNVLKIFIELDANLVQQCEKQYQINQANKTEKLTKNKEHWNKLQSTYNNNNNNSNNMQLSPDTLDNNNNANNNSNNHNNDSNSTSPNNNSMIS